MKDPFDLLLRSLKADMTVEGADKLWRKVLAHSGHRFKKGVRFLGAGSYGCAFGTDNGRVLKLTFDPSEARTMQKVQRSPTDSVVRIHDTFQVNPARTKTAMYGIVQERLVRPDPQWKDAVRYVGSVLKPKNEFLTPDTLRMYFYPKETRVGTTDVRHALIDQPGFKTWLTGLATYFETNGIHFEDFHGNNVMRLGKTHKLIDLGRSKRRTDRVPMVVIGCRIASRYGKPFPIVG